MKKVICCILSAIMVFTLAVPAFCGEATNNYPIITLRGDGEPLYDKDGKNVSSISDRTGGVDKSEIIEACVNVLQPLFINGLLLGDWEPYYESFTKEISDLFEGVLLDENGDATNGTSISQNAKNDNLNNMARTEGGWDYSFFYDWRLDPWETAEELDKYINAILDSRGCSKVILCGRCLGCSIVSAYIARYGYNKLKGLGYDVAVCFGNAIIGESFTGNMDLNGEAINRFLQDKMAFEDDDIDDILTQSLNLANKSGVTDTIVNLFKTFLYDKLKDELTGRIALVTIGSYPSEWSMVPTDCYDEAIEYVFGQPGDDKYEQYKGMIAKLDNYHENVAMKLNSILSEMSNNGVNLCIIAKYGTQTVPITKSSLTELGDKDVGLKYASIGASCAKSIYDTLPDEYIAQKKAEGKGDYISPDKQVDASTCLFPDYTWFIKGVEHANWTSAEIKLTETVLSSDTQLTVKTAPLPQYLVLEDPNNSNVLIPMTAENSDAGNWDAQKNEDTPKSKLEKVRVFLIALLQWLPSIVNKIKAKLTEINI